MLGCNKGLRDGSVGSETSPARPHYPSREAPYLGDPSYSQPHLDVEGAVPLEHLGGPRPNLVLLQALEVRVAIGKCGAAASGSSTFCRPGPSWLMVLMPLPSPGCGSTMESIICYPVRCQHGRGEARKTRTADAWETVALVRGRSWRSAARRRRRRRPVGTGYVCGTGRTNLSPTPETEQVSRGLSGRGEGSRL